MAVDRIAVDQEVDEATRVDATTMRWEFVIFNVTFDVIHANLAKCTLHLVVVEKCILPMPMMLGVELEGEGEMPSTMGHEVVVIIRANGTK